MSNVMNGSDDIYKYTPGALQVHEMRESLNDLDRKPDPIFYELLDILGTPVGAVRNAKADRFKEKYKVVSDESVPPTKSNTWKLRSDVVCPDYDKNMVCINEFCRLSHPDFEKMEEGFAKPDAKLVPCPTKCTKKGCPFKHEMCVQDEALIGNPPEAPMPTGACFAIQRLDADWVDVGQCWYNKVNFVTTYHVKTMSGEGAELRVWDHVKQRGYPIIKWQRLETHVCTTENCDDKCSLNDLAIIVLDIPTERIEELHKTGQYIQCKAMDHTIKPGKLVVLCWIEKGQPQMRTGKIVEVHKEFFTTDIPSISGRSGGCVWDPAAAKSCAMHKGSWTKTENRHLFYTTSAVQQLNNQHSTKKPKNE
jgi:hypothetical protein